MRPVRWASSLIANSSYASCPVPPFCVLPQCLSHRFPRLPLLYPIHFPCFTIPATHGPQSEPLTDRKFRYNSKGPDEGILSPRSFGNPRFPTLRLDLTYLYLIQPHLDSLDHSHTPADCRSPFSGFFMRLAPVENQSPVRSTVLLRDLH